MPRRAARSLRAWLTGLLLLVLVPPLLLAIALGAKAVVDEQRDLAQGLRLAAEELASSVNRIVLSQQHALALLAASEAAAVPQRRDEFRARAATFLAGYRSHVVLASPDGGVLMDTRVSDGVLPPLRLPQGSARMAVTLAASTGKPALSDVFDDPATGLRLVATAVPVWRDGQAVAVVVATQEASSFERLLSLRALPPGWTLSLRDAGGQLVASTAAGALPPGGNGHAFAVPFEASGWSASAQVAPEVAAAPLRRTAVALGSLVLLVAAVALVGGAFVARRLGLAVAGLAAGGVLPRGAARVYEVERACAHLATSRRERAEALGAALTARNVLRETLARVSDGFVALDRAWRFTFVNRVAAQTLGVEDEATLPGRLVWDVSPEMRGQPVHQAAERALASSERQRVEYFDARGQRWIEACLFPSAAGLSVYLVDVTARRHAHSLLRASEERYRLLFAANPLPMWVYEIESLRFVDVNEAAVRHYGYSREEFLALKVTDIRMSADVPQFLASVNRTTDFAAQPVQDKGIFRHRTKAGRLIDVQITVSALEFDGRQARLVSVADITERLAAEREREAAAEALRASEQRYRDLFELNPNPMWVRDDDSLRLLAVNEAAVREYGYSRDEMLALTAYDLRPPMERDALRTRIAHARTDPAFPVWPEGLSTHQRKDGTLFEVEVVRSAIQFDGRMAYLVVGTVVAQRVRAEAERDRALLALAEREERLRLFVEYAPVALAMLDRDMCYVVASRRWRRDYGLDTLELVGRSHYEVFPEIGAAWKATHRRALAGEVVRNEQDRFERADGRVQWLRWELRPWGVPGGTVDGIVMFTEDITERVAAEQALRASEREFRELAEQMPAIVYRARPDEVHTHYVSPHIASLGYTPAEWCSREGPNWYSALHPDDRVRAVAAMATLTAAGTRITLEYRLRDRSGGWHDIVDHTLVLGRHEADELMAQGVLIDITSLKRTEQALREAEAYQRGLFEAIGDGVLLLDASHRVLDANPKALTMLGCRSAQLLACRLDDLVAERDRARVDETLVEWPAAGGAGAADAAVQLVEWEQLRCDGGSFPAEVSARAAGQGRFVAVLRDITERRAAERALMAYQMELSELTQRLLTQERETTRHVAQTLHDQLGQSLAVVRLRIDAAATRVGAAMPAPWRDEYERVAGALDQAIADVRIVLGELRPPMLEEQGLIAALDNEIRTRTLDAPSVDVLLEVDDGRLAARWPADVEYAAFMIGREAIVNAQKHAQATLVRVIVEGDASWLRLEVVDDGRGIPELLRSGRPGHLGIVGMRERALAIGARFTVEQPAEGGACVVLRWTASAAATAGSA